MRHDAIPSDFAEFACLLDDFERLESPRAEGDAALSADEVRLFFAEFENLWVSHLESNASHPPAVNIWQVAGLGRDEVRNCRALFWLLDWNESHCQGRRFLRCFLEAMGQSADVADEPSLAVKREERTWCGDSRIDLLLESDRHVICIEVKILAAEDTAQLDRYFEQVGGRARAQGKDFVGKFLTIGGKSSESVADGFTRLLWQDVATALRRFASSSDELYGARSTFVQALALQYASFVSLL